MSNPELLHRGKLQRVFRHKLKLLKEDDNDDDQNDDSGNGE